MQWIPTCTKHVIQHNSLSTVQRLSPLSNLTQKSAVSKQNSKFLRVCSHNTYTRMHSGSIDTQSEYNARTRERERERERAWKRAIPTTTERQRESWARTHVRKPWKEAERETKNTCITRVRVKAGSLARAREHVYQRHRDTRARSSVRKKGASLCVDCVCMGRDRGERRRVSEESRRDC